MSTIFRLDSSIRIEGSVSRAVADTLEAAILEAEGGGTTVTRRDVERSVLAGLSDAEVDTFRSLLARVTDGAPDDHSACGAPVPEC